VRGPQGITEPQNSSQQPGVDAEHSVAGFGSDNQPTLSDAQVGTGVLSVEPWPELLVWGCSQELQRVGKM